MILHGDVLDGLALMHDRSVQTCVTSPPYFGLRDYGVKGQIGLESSPDAYIERLVGVFREVRRALKDDGTLFLNLGDSYFSSSQRATCSLKPKDLIGIPWRVALALQTDGWYLRSDIIWHKPNPMPESVTDRPTKSHEYLFLLAKSERYYYDAKAIQEPVSGTAHARGNGINPKAAKVPSGWKTGAGRHDTIAGRYRPKQNASFSGAVSGLVSKRNKRTVWTVTTQPYRGAHFATFPEKLVEPCILAGSKPGDWVLDPFCGSGTVGVVAARLGREFIGVELNKKYVALAEARLAGASAPKAMAA